MHWDGFIDQIARWLEARSLLHSDARWVIGVSGGADSTLLLHALHSVSDARKLNWSLHVAHLHHGLRDGDADQDAAFVAALAEKLNIPLHTERADIRAQVASSGGSTEEVARQRRYEFLERIALKTGSELCAVAHHADDDAETILHRVVRGTGLRGLAGMRDIRPIQPGSRVMLIRPFIHQRRETIEYVARARGVEWRNDASNFTGEYTRGRIRNTVMPLLREQINPNVSEALLRLAEQARWLGTYLEDAAARTFESLLVAETPGRLVLNTRALLAKQRIIQAEVIRLAITLVLAGEQELGFSHIESVLRLAAEKSSGKEIHLPGPVLVKKVYDRLEFRPLTDAPETPPEMASTFVVCPGLTQLSMLGFDLTAEYTDVDDEKIDELRRTPHPYEEWLDLERIQFPLFVRGRREGDRFWPLGAPGSKSLGDFFSDEKIDPALRVRTGVLCDQAGPIWVMPLRIDERVKLRPTTRRAVRLLLTPNPRG
ncbi:MAG: tRNA lysidine(34) synthetase TilS [Planctomycetes bacterium]|nr:tRNA lysidine(34) synthetase TilS [Planctomycetota bacterium]